MNYRKHALIFYFIITFHLLYAQNKAIDVLHYSFEISLNDSNNIIRGTASINFRMKEAGSLVYFDLTGPGDSSSKGMKVLQVSENNKNLKFTQDSNHLNMYFTNPLPLNTQKNVRILYEGIPTDGLIISKNKFSRRTFFADNWPNRAHNWIPCNDHPSDKASVEFMVTAPDHYRVIANGILVAETNLADHRKLTHWKEDLVLPTKIMVIGVADFAVQLAAEINGIAVSSWVFPENKDSGFSQYAIAKNILPFYIKYIGPYPYRKLANVQSKTIFGGMENAGNIFYYENSVRSGLPSAEERVPIEGLVAHEIAHQWFGDEASETGWQHVWLSEGFATYMTHLYFENKYGADSLETSMQCDRDTVTAFYKKRKTPIVDTSYGKNPVQLLNRNSYEKGSWVLHMLRRKLGDRIFQKGVRAYYATYRGKNASTDDFRRVMEKVSKQNLRAFFQQWLYTAGHPTLQGKWKYNYDKDMLRITINQTQDSLFQFPLQLAIRGAKRTISKTIEIRNRNTSIAVSLNFKPATIFMDPGINLLFEGNIEEE